MDENIMRTSSRAKRAKQSASALANVEAGRELAREVQKVVRPQESKRGPGQPTKFTRERWDEIITAIATYGDLIEICQGPGMPCPQTVYKWYRDDPALKDEIRIAWENFSMIGWSVNNNILRGGVLSTGDFRRDEALVVNNRDHMKKTNRRDFGDKVQVDVVDHKVFVMPPDVIDGEGY